MTRTPKDRFQKSVRVKRDVYQAVHPKTGKIRLAVDKGDGKLTFAGGWTVSKSTLAKVLIVVATCVVLTLRIKGLL